MTTKSIPFSKEQLEKIIAVYPTPFHIYDEKAMRENARRFIKAFSWNEGFKEYYAIKAAPNPYLMKILREEGFGIDCSSETRPANRTDSALRDLQERWSPHSDGRQNWAHRYA